MRGAEIISGGRPAEAAAAVRSPAAAMPHSPPGGASPGGREDEARAAAGEDFRRRSGMPDAGARRRLRRLTAVRGLFGVVLLGSTLFVLRSRGVPASEPSAAVLLFLAGAVILLSVGYTLALAGGVLRRVLASLELALDTPLVTAVVAVTGGLDSPFVFLYLVVILTSSLLLGRGGTFLVTALCCLQSGLLAAAEAAGFALETWLSGGDGLRSASGPSVLPKLAILWGACLVVAGLGSFLAGQTEKTRRELRRMQDHLKRVERLAAVGELAAGLAHELKNPLAGLTGAIELLRDDLRYDPERAPLLSIVLREADRLSTLVSHFLLYARPPAGRPEPVEAVRAVRETLELFTRQERLKNRIQTRLAAPEELWIAIDPRHLQQVLWNLLANAAEAIEGEGRIEVVLFARRDKSVCLEVRDTGTGIAPEHLAAIFDPFFSTKPAGTGLGLSIVQRILEPYECRLDVESAPGRGSTFRLVFPRIDPPVPP